MVRKEALFRKRVLLLSCAAAALMLFALLVPLRPSPAEAAGELVSLHDAHRAESFTFGSRWVGLLTISEHAGCGLLEDGTREIRGVIGRDEKGTFFELYNREDPDTARPLLTLGVRLDYHTMIPVIGEEDAVYFYIWLDSRDVEPFTLKLENGGLSQCYYYDDGNETCRIEFHVKQEKNT